MKLHQTKKDLDIFKILNDLHNKYPKHPIQDDLKAIYQAALGPGHLVTNEAYVYLLQELKQCQNNNYEYDDLNNYVRLHLYNLKDKLKAETIFRIFSLSSKMELQSNIKEAINEYRKTLNKEADLKCIEKYINDGYPSLHHSDLFKETYRPSYRLVAKIFIDILPLLIEIDNNNKQLIIAIDGQCASGKTTLSNILKEIFNCDIVHLDDFFLQAHQRSNERLSIAGENIDHERFLKEILIPLSNNENYEYKPFDCQTFSFKEAKLIKPQSITIIEGSYALHPNLAPYYDLRIVLTIDENSQSERLLKRNKQLYPKFKDLWIPLENQYLKEKKITANCDYLFQVI